MVGGKDQSHLRIVVEAEEKLALEGFFYAVNRKGALRSGRAAGEVAAAGAG